MKLSHLQKYILLAGYEETSEFSRGRLLKFYNSSASAAPSPKRLGRVGDKTTAGKQKKKPKKEDQANIITKSLERLIGKGFLIGYGVRTPKKWFIKKIKLTAAGRKMAKKLQGEQQALPFKK